MPQIFRFENISKISWISHGISTKEFRNLSLGIGGDKKEVLRNRGFFFTSLGIREMDVVGMDQVHGNHVAIVGEEERGCEIAKTDALLSNVSRVALFVKVADCVPILLVDPVKKVVGAVHAGWRGTAAEIVKITVAHMEDHFKTDPKNLIAGIGPSIGPCCYEVDTPVISEFKYKFKYADKLFSKIHDGHANLNLWQANKFQLIETGVREENIEVANLCTHDNSKLFFSDRREKKRVGRFGALIYITE